MEEVQDAVVDSAGLCPKLVDAVSEEVGVGPSELVSEGSKHSELGDTGGVGLGVPPAVDGESVTHRHVILLLLVENKRCLWHPCSFQYMNIIISCQGGQALDRER